MLLAVVHSRTDANTAGETEGTARRAESWSRWEGRGQTSEEKSSSPIGTGRKKNAAYDASRIDGLQVEGGEGTQP